MCAKSLIAAALAASLATVVPVAPASAHDHDHHGHVHIGIGFGFGGFYPADPLYGYGYGYNIGYGYDGISCWKGARIVQWAGFHQVAAFDCGAPVYNYKARKAGDWYRVRV